MNASIRAYARTGRATFTAQRAATNPPSANPVMNAASTVLIATGLVPITSCR